MVIMVLMILIQQNEKTSRDVCTCTCCMLVIDAFIFQNCAVACTMKTISSHFRRLVALMKTRVTPTTGM